MSLDDTLPSSGPRITGWHVLFAMIAFFLVVIGVNGIMMYNALSTFGGLETQDAYRKGLAYNARIAAEEAQMRLGWAADVVVETGNAGLSLSIKDRDGQPVSGLTVNGEIGRAATNRFDQTLALAEAAPGVYQARVTKLEPGSWVLNITASRASSSGEDRYEIRRRVWASP